MKTENTKSLTMKSILLLLLFVSGFTYANPIVPTPVAPYVLCDINNDGIEAFDLHTKDVEIIMGQPNVIISYYETALDAQSDANPILSNIYYNIVPFVQTIYVRATDITDNSFAITTMDLQLYSVPLAIQPGNLEYNDIPFDGFGFFNLYDNNSAILGGQTGMTITYFLTLVDAQNNTNSIPTPTTFLNDTNPQTIYARVENITTGCFDTTNFQLMVTNPDIVYIPDANFKAKLITLGVDMNLDGNIQTSEALSVSNELNVDGNSIADLTGFEAFTNVSVLRCSNNNLTVLNLNNMPNLKVVECGFNLNLNSLNISNISLDSLKVYNNNMSGINLSNLTSLKHLDCSYNHISNLDLSGMTNLKKLNCTSNWLTGLTVSTLTNLEELRCGSNQISSINVTPLTKLKILECSGNNLTTLSIANMPNLELLGCANNQCTSLNISNLPNLKHLNCGGNSLTYLDVSSFSNLLYLDCSGNHSTSLTVAGLANLDSLYSSLNELTTLDLTGLTNLQHLTCGSNQLTSLNINGLNNLVTVWASDNDLTSFSTSSLANLSLLHLEYNQLTNLNVSGLPNLSHLYCNNNLLTSINITGDTMLNWFDCHENQLTTIDFSGLNKLENVLCDHNQLTSLDFSGNPIFQNLSCTFNNLTDINIKNGYPYINTNNFWHENPNLVFVCADEEELNQVQQILVQSSLGSVTTNTYCTFIPGGDYNTIAGSIVFDANNNGCDASDATQSNIRMNVNDGTNQGATFTDASGSYKFYTQAGSFDITPAIENSAWFNFTPTTATIPFTDNNNNTATQNFCLTANGTHPDLEIIVTPITPARPGFDAVYKIVYKNKGNQIMTQSSYGINFFYNQNLMSVSSTSVTPDAEIPGSLSWNYANLMPFESRTITVTFSINTPTDTNPVNIGDILTFNTVIFPQAGDENVTDNTFVFNQTVVGSFDPNEITCLEGDLVAPTEIGKYLHYVINFENTGNYQAENVVVKDVIDTTKYDVNSLQVLSSSHPAYTKINGNTVEFIFKNINLAAAGGNPPVGGHGDVLFKIKSKSSLVTGDYVSKTAKIYFDYNAPITTNDAQTTFQTLSNPIHQLDNSVIIYPNPTKTALNISSKFGIKTIQLFDIQGRILETDLINSKETTFDISSKQNGVYFLKITSEYGSKIEKVVKE